jgi:hypothetical protein
MDEGEEEQGCRASHSARHSTHPRSSRISPDRSPVCQPVATRRDGRGVGALAPERTSARARPSTRETTRFDRAGSFT